VQVSTEVAVDLGGVDTEALAVVRTIEPETINVNNLVNSFR
jgi:hypothetical protein